MNSRESSNETEFEPTPFRRAFVFLVVLLMIGGAYWLGLRQGQGDLGADLPDEPIAPQDAIITNKNAPDRTVDFSLFWKTWEILKDKYVDREDLDARTLLYGAIDGMLAASGDPYTTFFDPEENREFREDISGTFEGIGAEMGLKDSILTIIAPLEGTPAERAGLQANDKVLAIDDEPTTGMSLDQAVSKIRGEQGTEVTLTIFHEGDAEEKKVRIERDVITVKSVRLEFRDENIAYLRLSRFGDDTEAEFRAAVREIQSRKPRGLIVDMRNNPGGYLETALQLGSSMLPQGRVVVIEEYSSGDKTELKARGGDVLSGIPTVVLVNEGSASASEILAAALGDNRDNVTVVGTKTFGKGSVQELIPVTKDTAVKITVAKWLTPRGEQINEVGITPSETVERSREDVENDRDPQLDRALEILAR